MYALSKKLTSKALIGKGRGDYSRIESEEEESTVKKKRKFTKRNRNS